MSAARFRLWTQAVIVLAVLLVAPTVWTSPRFRFQNITASARFFSPRGHGGHGVQCADVTGDGWVDIYVTHIYAPNENRPDLLFVNLHDGAFREQGAAAGVADDGFFGRLSEESHAAVLADFDSDGDYDLFNAHTWSGNHRLYRNDGTGQFLDVSDSDGIQVDRREARGVAAGDVNGDGHLDLVVSAWAGLPMQLYLGRGNLQFDRGTDFGPRAKRLANQGIMLVDYDNDGDLDLVVTGHEPIDPPIGAIAIYRNEGRGRFVDATVSSGIRLGDEGTNGWSFGDLDNDADLDAIVVGRESSWVYLNRGGGRFELQQELARTNYTAALGDFDHDSDLDVYVGGTEAIYENDGRGRLELVRDVGIVGVGNDGRGVCLADLDRDGDLDIVLASKRGANTMFRNELNDANWLQVRLVGARGDAGAFGAKVTVYDSRHLDDPAHFRGFREARGATGYCSQDSPVLHFGVPSGQPYDVKAVFLDGRIHVVKGVTAPAEIVIDPNAPLR